MNKNEQFSLCYPTGFLKLSCFLTGGKQLPDVNELTKLFVRKTFKPDPLRTSVLFAFFAQHFTHQFFKTDFKKGSDFTWSRGHGVSKCISKGQTISYSREGGGGLYLFGLDRGFFL